MSRTRTLTELIADVRQRTNLESSVFVTDPEITEYINQELAELWSRLTQGGGQPFYRAFTAISVTVGTSLYALPADFWTLQGVEATLNGVTGALTPFMPVQRAGLTVASPWGTCSPVRYRLQAGNIEFLPANQAFTATVFYTPTCPRLVGGADTFDGFNGFELAAIYGACATLQAKEESDYSFYAGQKERIYKHLDSLSGARDASMPERVEDVMGVGPWDFVAGAGWLP